MRRTLAFVLGFLLAALLTWARPVDAQAPTLAFGSNAGTAVPFAVDASGNLTIVVQQ